MVGSTCGRLAVAASASACGDLLETDFNDATCGSNPIRIGPDNDQQPGGCDNVRVLISGTAPPQVSYWRGVD